MKRIIATEGMVLCDGYSKTSVGGSVYCPDYSTTVWEEMTDEEADVLIAKNTLEDEPATEEDYLEALAKLGVTE